MAWRRCSLTLALLVATGCQDPQNRAAKDRVFSPPPPDPVREAAKVPVDLKRVASDLDYGVKVLSVRFPEAHARLGSGKFTLKQTLTLERGAATVTVEERGAVEFNTHGDMSVELRTGPTEAMQLVYSNEVIYLRNRGGAWRASRDPTDERHFWADQTFSALRSVVESFRSRLVLTAEGPERVGERQGTRFALSLSGPPGEPDPLGERPEGDTRTTVPLPDGGTLFPSAQAHRRMLRGAAPQSLAGFVVLDNEKGVPLSANLSGSLKLAGPKLSDLASMSMTLEMTILEVGRDVVIRAPQEAVEEIVRRRVPVNPLEFLDAGTGPPGKPAAGKGKKEPPPEPVEDAEEAP